jgi:hypothetical protein
MKNSQTDKKCHFPKYPEKSLSTCILLVLSKEMFENTKGR